MKKTEKNKGDSPLRIYVSPSDVFIERLDAYMAATGKKSRSSALVGLAHFALKEFGYIPSPEKFEQKTWGGKRKGAGRNKPGRPRKKD